MTPVETTFVTEKYRDRCEDRVAVFNSDCRTVIVVADGAGGMGADGFFDYAKLDAITQIIYQSDFYTIPRTCVELVRLPSGELWDDTGIVAA